MNAKKIDKISIKDYVVLVTEKNHPRFGQLGKLEKTTEEGGYCVKFLNGKVESFSDKMHLFSSSNLFYRHYDKIGRKLDKKGSGPVSLFKKYLKLKKSPLAFAIAYYKLFSFEEEYKNLPFTDAKSKK
jgi:hypothetical protein